MDKRRDIPQRDASGRRALMEAVADLLRGADIRVDVQETTRMSDGQSEANENISTSGLLPPQSPPVDRHGKPSGPCPT